MLNYGAGGAGYQASWGMAEEALAQLERSQSVAPVEKLKDLHLVEAK